MHGFLYQFMTHETRILRFGPAAEEHLRKERIKVRHSFSTTVNQISSCFSQMPVRPHFYHNTGPPEITYKRFTIM
jgi:hypothetical protein